MYAIYYCVLFVLDHGSKRRSTKKNSKWSTETSGLSFKGMFNCYFKKKNQYSSCGIDSHACLPSYITSRFAYFFHAYGIILIA